MPHTDVIKDIPDSDVDQVMQDFKDDGATATKQKQANGLWTVTAIYP